MKMTRQFLLVSAATVLLGVCLHAQMMPGRMMVRPAPAAGANTVAQKSKCSGTVTDAAGSPLAGATVAYWRYDEDLSPGNQLKLDGQITTDTNGAFEFPVTGAFGFVLAQKPGLAPAWKQLSSRMPEGDLKLALTPPTVLAGTVEDETGKPVANAEVFVSMAVSNRCVIFLRSARMSPAISASRIFRPTLRRFWRSMLPKKSFPIRSRNQPEPIRCLGAGGKPTSVWSWNPPAASRGKS